MIIRPAVFEDLKTIAELERKIFDENNFPMSIRNLKYHFKKKNMILVASSDDAINGYALVFIRPNHARIYSIATVPQFRGTGVGKKLMESIISQVKNISYISLEVRKDNTSAIKLYEKYGFQTVREIREYYDDGCSALKMKKSLHNL